MSDNIGDILERLQIERPGGVVTRILLDTIGQLTEEVGRLEEQLAAERAVNQAHREQLYGWPAFIGRHQNLSVYGGYKPGPLSPDALRELLAAGGVGDVGKTAVADLADRPQEEA